MTEIHVPSKGLEFQNWLTDTVRILANQMCENQEYSALPILADALQDAGCNDEDFLDLCRHHQAAWLAHLLVDKIPTAPLPPSFDNTSKQLFNRLNPVDQSQFIRKLRQNWKNHREIARFLGWFRDDGRENIQIVAVVNLISSERVTDAERHSIRTGERSVDSVLKSVYKRTA